MDNTAYSKREQDLFRTENKEQFERVMQALNDMRTSQAQEFKDIKDKQGVDHKTLELLCTTVSENSGSIGELWKAHKLIEDITAVYKTLKWFVYIVIGVSSLIVALKIILATNFYKINEILK